MVGRVDELEHNKLSSKRSFQIPPNLESVAWSWLRYSGFFLIPLAFIHVLLQDVLVGVHNINMDYVSQRWALPGWRIYDAFLLIFAFAHGVSGLHQVLKEYVHPAAVRWWLGWGLLVFWMIISVIGGIAIINGVRPSP